MTLDEILATDGVVIRKIPATTTSRWSYYPKTQTIREDEKLIWVECKPAKDYPDGRKQVVERTQQNSLAGYVVDFCLNQDSIVRFDKMSGYGATIEEAHNDYFKKKGTINL